MPEQSLREELEAIFAKSHRALEEAGHAESTDVAGTIAAFVTQRTDALEAAILRLARELEARQP